MPLTSSQGNAYGIAGATKVSIKKARASNPGDNKLDSSTLDIAHGGERVYEDGLVDNGPQGATNGGIVTTVTVDFLGEPSMAAGEIAEFDGVDCKCIDVETTNEAGALIKGVANYTSDFPAE
jgi:hypothetical protein